MQCIDHPDNAVLAGRQNDPKVVGRVLSERPHHEDVKGSRE
jgi:hypothetical protein